MKILIAYFSHGGENLVDGNIVNLNGKGNTKVAALALETVLKERGINPNLFEITPSVPYSVSYEETNARSRHEHDEGILTPIQAGPNGFENYDVIFLGYPNWYGTIPSPVRSFLTSHDFNGKLILPFVTHGGHRFLYSLDQIQKDAPGAKIVESFAINAAYMSAAPLVTKKWVEDHKDLLGL